MSKNSSKSHYENLMQWLKIRNSQTLVKITVYDKK
jgi:hypothetical protein